MRFLHGEYAAARGLCAESLGLRDDSHGATGASAACLGVLAAIATETGQPERALRLFLAAEAIGATAAEAAFSAGRNMSLDQAIAYALEDLGQDEARRVSVG